MDSYCSQKEVTISLEIGGFIGNTALVIID